MARSAAYSVTGFTQHGWDGDAQEAWQQLLRLAVREDLGRLYDFTTMALVEPEAIGAAAIVARSAGVAAGLAAIPQTLAEYDARLEWQPAATDGDAIGAGQVLGSVRGSARSLLTAERVLLNLLGRLSGVATATRHYVQAVSETQAAILDTRKTTPGWRVLEKYAVRCGGGMNHRTGLFDAILIKDNHLALVGSLGDSRPSQAVNRARSFVAEMLGRGAAFVVEVEVDGLEQLADALTAHPHAVLLDNFSIPQLREAVALRDERAPEIPLEASGGVTLTNVAAVAATGVERISIGALTHSAPWLDIGLDWQSGPIL